MQVTVTGRHMSINDSLRDYAEQKFGRLAKIFDAEPLIAEVVLSEEKNKSNPNKDIAEVTLRLKGHVVRAEEAAPDMHSAIDLAASKAEAQMRKYKTRVVDRRNHAGQAVKTAPGAGQIPEEEPAAEPAVSRVKTIAMKPMTEDEALLQMELLGHDFFVFRHAETDLVSVLYRRRGGDFGLIQPSA